MIGMLGLCAKAASVMVEEKELRVREGKERIHIFQCFFKGAFFFVCLCSILIFFKQNLASNFPYAY